MLGINVIDWLVIAGYLAGIMVIGVRAVKKVRSAASFFIGDRKFGKVMMMFFAFGAGQTEMEGRVGVMCGIMFKRICTIAWVLTGLCAVGLYMSQNIDVDHLWTYGASTAA